MPSRNRPPVVLARPLPFASLSAGSKASRLHTSRTPSPILEGDRYPDSPYSEIPAVQSNGITLSSTALLDESPSGQANPPRGRLGLLRRPEGAGVFRRAEAAALVGPAVPRGPEGGGRTGGAGGEEAGGDEVVEADGGEGEDAAEGDAGDGELARRHVPLRRRHPPRFARRSSALSFASPPFPSDLPPPDSLSDRRPSVFTV